MDDAGVVRAGRDRMLDARGEDSNRSDGRDSLDGLRNVSGKVVDGRHFGFVVVVVLLQKLRNETFFDLPKELFDRLVGSLLREGLNIGPFFIASEVRLPSSA